jgi:plastocyanin domain-containing protein
VTEGSVLVRAARERLGPPAVHNPRVTVNDSAFEPSRVPLRAGVLARITFVRVSDKTCATAVTFPALRITRPLPLNQPVTVEFTPARGERAFVCGMGMLPGAVVAE